MPLLSGLHVDCRDWLSISDHSPIEEIRLTGCGLVACNLGPHYKRPDIPPPQAWRDAPNAEQSGWPSSDWWRGFNSPTLNDLMDQARVAGLKPQTLQPSEQESYTRLISKYPAKEEHRLSDRR